MSALAQTAAKTPDESLYRKWKAELDFARDAPSLKRWIRRGRDIVKRYRDEASASNDLAQTASASQYNILWSNIQTLKPALYAKAPTPVVERKYLDRDPVGRVASMILQRALSYQIENGGYHLGMEAIVEDRLLPGRGTLRARYVPVYDKSDAKVTETKTNATNNILPISYGSNNPSLRSNATDNLFGLSGGDEGHEKGGLGQSEFNQPLQTNDGQHTEDQLPIVVYESVCVDYIDWEDFLCSPARRWEEVRWIAFRSHLTRDELIKRFPNTGELVQLADPTKSAESGDNNSDGMPPNARKAAVWEIWDKTTRTVIFISDGYQDGPLEDPTDDPLRLENFWPMPRPLFATITNNSLVPVPDFVLYQDQARELDELTSRISALTKCIKAAGTYDASVDGLKRIFEEGTENELIPVADWSQFAEKGGVKGSISLVPIKELADVLLQLYEARERVKQVLYEITGISDIIRGQGAAGATATEQRIKGQFATLRLNKMQSDVNRFACEMLQIMGEIIAEHFDPMTLFLVSGYEQYSQDQFIQKPQAPQPPQIGHNGGPPLEGAPAAPQEQQPPAPPEPTPQQKAAQQFQEAVTLLRNDKLRGFRIDIESDSMIEPDQQAAQQSVVELFGAMAQFLPQAIALGEKEPAFGPLMGKMILYALRRFKGGRDLEAPFEQTIDDLERAAANPQPPQPSPEEIKAQSEQKRAEFDMQATQAKVQGELQLKQAEMQLKQMELQMTAQELELKKQELAMRMEYEQAKHSRDMEKLRFDRMSPSNNQLDLPQNGALS